MIIEKLKLKTKLKQFIFVLLILNNEVNHQLNKINSDYYTYAIYTNRTSLETKSSFNSTSVSHTPSNSSTSYSKHICNLDLTNNNKSSHDVCLISLVPYSSSSILFQTSNEPSNFSQSYTQVYGVNEFAFREFYRKYFEALNQMQYRSLTSAAHASSKFVFHSSYDVTVYNPSTKYLVRKLITRDEYDKFKLDYFSFSTPSEMKRENSSHETINSTLDVENQTPATVVSGDKMKFVYNFETDRIHDLNHMYKQYLNGATNDHLILLSLIQDKFTYNFYLHMRSKLGKSYLNLLYPDASLPSQNYYFKFKKTTTFLLRLKSVEYYNIIKYEIYTSETPSCEMKNLNGKDYRLLDRLPSSFLHCDTFNELAFFQEIQQRGKLDCL